MLSLAFTIFDNRVTLAIVLPEPYYQYLSDSWRGLAQRRKFPGPKNAAVTEYQEGS
jgi:hypothetical protein